MINDEDLMTTKLKTLRKFLAPGKTARGEVRFTSDSAFTLVELLTVIAIIGVLAAFILAVAGGVKKTEYISTATAQMNKIEAALERYKSQYGTYPPSGTNVLVNPLYYELVGTSHTNTANPGLFTTLDGNANGDPTFFGMSGFINCDKSGSGGDNGAVAVDFLAELKPNELGSVSNNTTTNFLLVVSVGGPDVGYGPAYGYNPWRYAYPGTNNPNSYDLWAQLVINQKTNLICNWSSKVQVGTPYP